MTRLSPILTGIGLCGALGAAYPQPLSADASAVPELLAAGRFQDAYEVSQRAGGTDRRLAMAQLARELLRASVASDDAYFRWFALQAIQSLHDSEIAAAVRPLAKSPDRYERSLALEFLGNVDPVASREDLLLGLESPFRSVRVRALRALMSVHEPEIGRRFAQLLASDPDSDLRALAARALAATGAVEFVPALEQALGDEDQIVQEEVVAALVALGDPRVPDLVRQRLADATGPERVRAIRLCALVPAPELLTELGPLLADGDSEVRAHAAGAVLSILEKQRRRKP